LGGRASGRTEARGPGKEEGGRNQLHPFAVSLLGIEKGEDRSSPINYKKKKGEQAKKGGLVFCRGKLDTDAVPRGTKNVEEKGPFNGGTLIRQETKECVLLKGV